jgi:hypothetical protein
MGNVMIITPAALQPHVILCSAACRRKAAEVNKKLGEKFEISETELLGTVEACSALLAEGQDLDTGEGATQVRHVKMSVTMRAF